MKSTSPIAGSIVLLMVVILIVIITGCGSETNTSASVEVVDDIQIIG